MLRPLHTTTMGSALNFFLCVRPGSILGCQTKKDIQWSYTCKSNNRMQPTTGAVVEKIQICYVSYCTVIDVYKRMESANRRYNNGTAEMEIHITDLMYSLAYSLCCTVVYAYMIVHVLR